ncbi:hypothetical protein GCM10009840_06260 [Pseudolysinimonas kribbensis]
MSRKGFLSAMIAAVVVLLIVVIGLVTLLLVPATAKPKPTRSASPTRSPSATPTPTPTPTFDKNQFSTTDATSLWVMVDKQHPLNPRDYAPALAPLNLPGYKGLMRPEAVAAMQKMFADYHAQSPTGDGLTVVSPYRSYPDQVSVYNGWVRRLGQAQADRQSARPGYSEHQTGLAVDIDTATNQGFGTTAAGQWLAQNSWRYGFVVRYQQGQEPITGYEYEPWHFRYVGVELATELQKQGFPSLETFFGYAPAPSY